MSDSMVGCVLLAFAIGQFVVLYRGLSAAVTYYLCVAPLGYFTVWYMGTWDPSRLCGIILLVGSLRFRDRDRHLPKMRTQAIVLFLGYGIVWTIICSPFWPTDAIAHLSLVHSVLRPLISIANWIVYLGVTWKIAVAYSVPGEFAKYKHVVVKFGIAMCFYAIYQSVASRYGLPMTGLRNAYRGYTADGSGDFTAAYLLNGELVYRPGSFFHEPKFLGAGCVFWLSLLLSDMFERQFRTATVGSIAIVCYTLWLTASTGAWAAVLCCLALFLFISNRLAPLQLMEKVLIGGLACFVGLGLSWAVGTEAFQNSALGIIVEERFTKRLSSLDRKADEELDPAAIQALLDRPYFILTGTGLGGISFYMDEYLRNSVDYHIPGEKAVILNPSFGLVALLANLGLLGYLFAYYTLERGFRCLFLRPVQGVVPIPVSLAFVGTIGVVQYMIMGDMIVFLVGMGCLLAASLYPRGDLEGLSRPVPMGLECE